MRCKEVGRIGLVALSFAAHRHASANSPVPPQPPACWEMTEKVCQALRIPDPAQRTSEARVALAEMLRSDKSGVASALGAMVQRLKNRVDLRPYADLFMASCEGSKARCFWNRSDEDWSLVWAGSRSERLDVFERAIRTGSARLGQDTIVSRKWAVRWAAEQGLEELRPLSDEYLATLTEARVKKLELTNVTAMFELCAGAGGYFDAARLAARRSAALPEQEFETRMAEEEGFRGAVLAIGRRVCETDPLMDDVAPECSLLAAVADRHRKVPAGPPVFDDSCGGGKGADWRAALSCSTRQGSYRRAKTTAFGALAEASALRKGDYRRPGLDPCSLPELAERGGNEELRDVWITLTDLSAIPPHEIDASVGIVGHRAGERVHFRIEVMDRSGRAPRSPAVVSIRLEGEQAGTLAHPGTPSTCHGLILLWSDPEKAGYRSPERRDFELTLGTRAAPAGLLPPDGNSGQPVNWWRESGRLHIKVSSVDKDLGAISSGHEETIALRAESDARGSRDLSLRLEADLERKNAGAILDANMEDKGAIVRGPVRQFLAMRRAGAKGDQVAAECRTSSNGVDMGHASLVARRVPGTSLFVAPFTLFPDGDPEPDTPPGRSVSGPLLKITVGESDMHCNAKETE